MINFDFPSKPIAEINSIINALASNSHNGVDCDLALSKFNMLLSLITQLCHQIDTCCYSLSCRVSAWRKKTNARRRKLKSKPIIYVLRLLVLGIAGTTFEFRFLETNLKHDIDLKEYNHSKIHLFSLNNGWIWVFYIVVIRLVI